MDYDDSRERNGGHSREPVKGRASLSRRDVLKSAAGTMFAAAGASVAGIFAGNAAAQISGTTPGGGAVPLRLPMCAVDELDRNQYIQNMEIHAHLSVANLYQGDRVTSPLWVKGSQRLLLCGGGRFVDITDPRNPVLTNEESIGGNGDLAYATHLKKWIIMTGRGPIITAPNPQYPKGKYHEEYAARSTNYEGFRGIMTHDATDPANVTLLQEFNTGETGSGSHANFYDGGRYAYLSCGWDNQLRMESSERPFSNALMIVDLWDPANIKEVSRWWVPGQRFGEEEEYKKWPFAGDQSSWTSSHGFTVPKRVEDGGDVCYGGWGSFGMYVHDLTDITKPGVYGRVSHPLEAMGGIQFHGIYPVPADASHPRLQNLVLGVFEALEADCREPWHTSYVVDIADKRNPKIIGLFPRPVPPPEAPYPDFCCSRGRFSSHNAQPWVAPGVAKPSFVAMTYFNAGIRIYDISEPTAPREVAYFLPPRAGDMEDFSTWRRGTTEGVFVEWDRNLVWVTTHEGLYCLSTPSLGEPVLEPRKVTQWTVPHINAGWDDGTPSAVYFGRGMRAFRRA